MLLVAGCGSDEEANNKSPGSDTTQTTTTRGGCKDVKQPRSKPNGGEQRPSGPLESGKAYTVKILTSCGAFTIGLDPETSPHASASFVSLARSGFFDNTTFHRIVPDFVIQGGDPTGSGSGGPGYSTRDVPPPNARYRRGVVAMAKTQDEPAGTAGSQFYVVTGADAGLPADYALLGKVTHGMDAVDRIARLGDPNAGEEGTPTQPVVIERTSVTVSAGPFKSERKKKRRRAR